MIEKFLVSRHPSLYQAWPDIVLSGSGKLIVTFMRCVHHNDRSYTALCLTESTDRGRSWSEPEVLVEAPGNPYWNCARISKLRDGRLAIVCDRIIEEKQAQAKFFFGLATMKGTAGRAFSHSSRRDRPRQIAAASLRALAPCLPQDQSPARLFRGAALVFR